MKNALFYVCHFPYLDLVLEPPVLVPERVEPEEERLELSRFTVVVRPLASVVLTVVRVVPLLLTLV